MTLLLENSALASLQSQIDFKQIPKHIAFIMDGNRRWAKQRGLPVLMGHWKGAEIIDRVVNCCLELGVKTLTVFAFSTENWGRSCEEVEYLLRLISIFLKKKKKTLIKEGVKLSSIGDLSVFPLSLQRELESVREVTSTCSKINLVLALNYGSRNEITRAVKKILDDVTVGKIQKQNVTENLISSYLDTSQWSDPELLIRTSGEKRLSNFLLWQLSYTEVHTTEILWPDFGEEELLKAIIEYQHRERRFGG